MIALSPHEIALSPHEIALSPHEIALSPHDLLFCLLRIGPGKGEPEILRREIAIQPLSKGCPERRELRDLPLRVECRSEFSKKDESISLEPGNHQSPSGVAGLKTSSMVTPK